MQFTQSGLGLTVFPVRRRCKQGTESLDRKLRLKTLFGLKLTKIHISQSSFFLLKKTLRKRMRNDKRCANRQLKKLVILWLKKPWDQFCLLCLKPRPPSDLSLYLQCWFRFIYISKKRKFLK